MLSDKDLVDVAKNCELCSEHLEFIYIELGLSQAEIGDAKSIANNPSFQLQAVQVLRVWRRKKADSATREAILSTIQACGYGRSKRILEEKWNLISEGKAKL